MDRTTGSSSTTRTVREGPDAEDNPIDSKFSRLVVAGRRRRESVRVKSTGDGTWSRKRKQQEAGPRAGLTPHFATQSARALLKLGEG
jgi:hypothetical protein